MLYIFDMDDTLIKGHLSPGGKNLKYNDVELLINRFEKIARLAAEPTTRFAIATNQGGVAFGFNTVEEMYAKLGKVVGAFRFFHGRPFSIHYCLSHENAPEKINGEDNPWRRVDPRRKPGPKMLEEAVRAHGFTYGDQAIYVGDLDTDRQAAEAAHIPYMHPEEFFEL